MKNLTKIKLICTPRRALAKLSRAEIPVWYCKKQGAWFTFSVQDIFLQKVFAIFSSPCYNITIEQKSTFRCFKDFAVRRIALLAGLVLFAACAFLSNAFVFRVEVTGSGAYLKNSVMEIARTAGLHRWAIYGGLDKTALVSGVLSLPSVTFCSVHKDGSIVYIDVQTEAEDGSASTYSALVSDCEGRLEKLVAISGTQAVEEGQNVNLGDVLIAPYTVVNEENIPCLASGYAVISRTVFYSFSCEEESEENLSKAYAAALLYADGEITSRSHTVYTTAEGAVYEVSLTYLHTITINFD